MHLVNLTKEGHGYAPTCERGKLGLISVLQVCTCTGAHCTGVHQAAISWRASGNRQISLNASAERAFANFRDKKHRILQLQIFATNTSFLHIFALTALRLR